MNDEAKASPDVRAAALELDARSLRRSCNPQALGFATTAELDVERLELGQARAANAIEFSLGMQHRGYNAFVLGPAGTGRRTLIERIVRRIAATRPTPSDWCYVNHFADTRRPIALRLPPGRAAALRRDVEAWVSALKVAIPAAFQGDAFRTRAARIEEEVEEHQRKALESLGERARGESVALVRTPAGFTIAPMSGDEVMTRDQYAKLSEEEQKKIDRAVERFQAELEQVMHDGLQARRQAVERLQALGRETTERGVATVTAELRVKYEDLPDVLAHIDASRQDVVTRAEEFRKPTEQTTELGPGIVLKAQIDFDRYRVNLLVDHGGSAGAPIVFEDNPTYPGLVGRVEHTSQLGTLITDFTQIQAGALHRANGGYLVIDAAKVLSQPFAWEALKRSLSTREVRIESLAQALSLISTVSLEPAPIPLDVKVLLFGPRHLYHLLDAFDPDFGALFRVAAELEDDVDWTDHAARAVADLVASLCRRDDLRPFTSEAVAAIVEQCARLADDSGKVSVHMQSIEDLVLESNDVASRAARRLVGREDVDRAVSDRRFRAGQLQERMQDAIRRGIVAIDTDGAVVGQVNALGVLDLGRTRFAHPQRITATARLGSGEVIDIQREVDLGGSVHSKGVLTLASFIGDRFARLQPLSLTASLTFEQTYVPVEGDSASVAEACALLSSLADVPLRQDLAITGSINQRGEVQAVGAVNDKIEGFYDLCAARGLTGRQGVIVPKTNRQHLMLRVDVVDAVARGEFHVYAIAHVDEAIGLLTGVPAGAEDVAGAFAAGTVNGLVAARLAQFAALALRREAKRRSSER